MTLASLWASILGAAGIGVGIAIGLGIGLTIRKNRGSTEGLIGGSVLVTAALIGIVVMVVAGFMSEVTR